MPASLESPAGTAPSVLLIEEYDALAAAITSALKKFAPRHRTRVVQSLVEAAGAAAEIEPQLFIIDFDPPHRNAVEFLNKLSAEHPEARVLAIASGTAGGLAAERYGPNAIQFIEKPFELADFGAAVQALLGPWTEARSGDSRGTLRDLNIRDLVPIQCVNATTGVLKIKAPHGQAGEIHFLDGQIAHATTANENGVAALHEIMRWKDARGKERTRLADAPRTIHGSWQQVFLEALRQTRPSPEEMEKTRAASLPAAEPGPPKPRPKKGKKIVVIDDTEMLLIFVEDSLATADPSLTIVTAFTGAEGARRAEVMIPDLVLLDYSLPDLRGDQVCERLLQNEATARIPVVMMSGHVPEMMATAERYRNVVATIPKPFMSEELINLVRETVAKGPLPIAAKSEAVEVASVEKAGARMSAETKPARKPNGKKPAKKLSNGETAAKPAGETPMAQRPASIPAPPVQQRPPPPAIPPPPIHPLPPATVPAPSASPSPPPREIRPAEPALSHPTPATPPPASSAKLGPVNGSAVVLGLAMEVLSVQFTPRFQVGTIRARPSAKTLSLTQPSTAENIWGAGFELGKVEIDPQGQIRSLHVVPMRRPAEPVRTHNGFDINNVALINGNAGIELSAGTAAPMTLQLVAVFKVAGVELSDRFEVAQLVLQPAGNRVRITLDSQPRGTSGSEFDTMRVSLDASARISEFVLNSVGA